SMDKIAAGLQNDGILTGAGRKKWWASTVKKILTNEKYIGDALLQKTYTTDFLNKTRVKNNGIVPQYYVKDNHQAIIPKKIFMEVQSEFARRATKKSVGPNGKKRSFSSNNAFSNIIFCGTCNEVFCRVHWYRNNQSYIKWRCGSKLDKNGVPCDSKSIDEKDLHDMVISAINAMLASKNDYLDILQANIQKIIDHSSTPDIVAMDNKLMNLQEELLQKVNDHKKYDDIADEILELRELKAKAETDIHQRNTSINRIKEVCDFIKMQPQELTEFDEPLIRRLLDSIIAYNDHITVRLKSGISIDVSK
ncbi:MAG: recombinase family protein, partial [Anaerovibrio sp.]|nr:recombinase family protein [Anaerovibrio sp.]